MVKFTLKYSGIASADKMESAKACLIAEFGYGAEEAEFYLMNPPIDLLETEDESEAKGKLAKLLAAGALGEIFGSTGGTTQAVTAPTPASVEKDPMQELIFELEEATDLKPEANKPEPKKAEAPEATAEGPELQLEFETESTEPANVKAEIVPTPASKVPEPELSLEFALDEDLPTPTPPATKEKPAENKTLAEDLSLSLEIDAPAGSNKDEPPKIEAPKIEETHNPNEKHIEVEAGDKTVFKIEIGKVLSGSTITPKDIKKKSFRVPPEYVIPLMAGAGVIIVMAYILFPSRPDSSIKKPLIAQQTEGAETPAAAQEEIKFYKYAAEFKDESITSKATFTATDKGLKFVNLDVVTPFAPELTAEEIVLKKKPRPWLSKITIDKLNFTLNKETGTFDTSSQARAFLEYGDEKVRIAAPIIGRAKYEAGQKEFQAAFLIKYNVKEIPAGKTYGITAENETYSFFVKFQLTAKLISSQSNKQG